MCCKMYFYYDSYPSNKVFYDELTKTAIVTKTDGHHGVSSLATFVVFIITIITTLIQN